jgi:putative transposase
LDLSAYHVSGAYSDTMSRLRRLEQQDRIFFVTSNLAKGTASLAERERDLVLASLAQTRTAHGFLLFGYVVMPDHVHAVLAVTRGSLSDIMHEWKRTSASSIQKARRNRGPSWQARYFDFICRRTRDVGNKLEYIHQNPVVAGLVSRADQWRWSSVGFYSKTHVPPIIPDIMDFSGDPDELLWPAPWRRK